VVPHGQRIKDIKAAHGGEFEGAVSSGMLRL
jgi:hypothetical protein